MAAAGGGEKPGVSPTVIDNLWGFIPCAQEIDPDNNLYLDTTKYILRDITLEENAGNHILYYNHEITIQPTRIKNLNDVSLYCTTSNNYYATIDNWDTTKKKLELKYITSIKGDKEVKSVYIANHYAYGGIWSTFEHLKQDTETDSQLVEENIMAWMRGYVNTWGTIYNAVEQIKTLKLDENFIKSKIDSLTSFLDEIQDIRNRDLLLWVNQNYETIFFLYKDILTNNKWLSNHFILPQKIKEWHDTLKSHGILLEAYAAQLITLYKKHIELHNLKEECISLYEICNQFNNIVSTDIPEKTEWYNSVTEFKSCKWKETKNIIEKLRLTGENIIIGTTKNVVSADILTFTIDLDATNKDDIKEYDSIFVKIQDKSGVSYISTVQSYNHVSQQITLKHKCFLSMPINTKLYVKYGPTEILRTITFSLTERYRKTFEPREYADMYLLPIHIWNNVFTECKNSKGAFIINNNVWIEHAVSPCISGLLKQIRKNIDSIDSECNEYIKNALGNAGDCEFMKNVLEKDNTVFNWTRDSTIIKTILAQKATPAAGDTPATGDKPAPGDKPAAGATEPPPAAGGAASTTEEEPPTVYPKADISTPADAPPAPDAPGGSAPAAGGAGGETTFVKPNVKPVAGNTSGTTSSQGGATFREKRDADAPPAPGATGGSTPATKPPPVADAMKWKEWSEKANNAIGGLQITTFEDLTNGNYLTQFQTLHEEGKKYSSSFGLGWISGDPRGTIEALFNAMRDSKGAAEKAANALNVARNASDVTSITTATNTFITNVKVIAEKFDNRACRSYATGIRTTIQRGMQLIGEQMSKMIGATVESPTEEVVTKLNTMVEAFRRYTTVTWLIVDSIITMRNKLGAQLMKKTITDPNEQKISKQMENACASYDGIVERINSGDAEIKITLALRTDEYSVYGSHIKRFKDAISAYDKIKTKDNAAMKNAREKLVTSIATLETIVAVMNKDPHKTAYDVIRRTYKVSGNIDERFDEFMKISKSIVDAFEANYTTAYKDADHKEKLNAAIDATLRWAANTCAKGIAHGYNTASADNRKECVAQLEKLDGYTTGDTKAAIGQIIKNAAVHKRVYNPLEFALKTVKYLAGSMVIYKLINESDVTDSHLTSMYKIIKSYDGYVDTIQSHCTKQKNVLQRRPMWKLHSMCVSQLAELKKLYENFQKTMKQEKVKKSAKTGTNTAARQYASADVTRKMVFDYDIDGVPKLDEGPIGLYQLALILGFRTNEGVANVAKNTSEGAYRNGKPRVLAIGSASWRRQYGGAKTLLDKDALVDLIHELAKSSSESTAWVGPGDWVTDAKEQPSAPAARGYTGTLTADVDTPSDKMTTYAWEKFDPVHGKWHATGDSAKTFTARESGTYRCVVKRDGVYASSAGADVHVATLCKRCGRVCGAKCTWHTYKHEELVAWETAQRKLSGKHAPFGLEEVVRQYNGRVKRGARTDPVTLDVRYSNVDDIYATLERAVGADAGMRRYANFVYRGVDILQRLRERRGERATRGLRLGNITVAGASVDDARALQYDYVSARREASATSKPVKHTWTGPCSADGDEPEEPSAADMHTGSFVDDTHTVAERVAEVMMDEMHAARRAMVAGEYAASKSRVYRALVLEDVLRDLQSKRTTEYGAVAAVRATHAGSVVVEPVRWARARAAAMEFLAAGTSAQRTGAYQMLFRRIV